MNSCSSGGRKRSRVPEEGRAGPEREFEKRKEVGFGRTPSHPLAASLQDDVRPLAQPWLPGAKLTRSGKAWVGVGMGSESGRRAGGGRTTYRKMLRELAGHVDSRSEGSVAPSASCGVSRAGERRQGGEEGGHPTQQASPSPHHLPHLHRLPSLHKAYAFPRQGPAQCLATRCSMPDSETLWPCLETWPSESSTALFLDLPLPDPACFPLPLSKVTPICLPPLLVPPGSGDL